MSLSSDTINAASTAIPRLPAAVNGVLGRIFRWPLALADRQRKPLRILGGHGSRHMHERTGWTLGVGPLHSPRRSTRAMVMMITHTGAAQTDLAPGALCNRPLPSLAASIINLGSFKRQSRLTSYIQYMYIHLLPAGAHITCIRRGDRGLSARLRSIFRLGDPGCPPSTNNARAACAVGPVDTSTATPSPSSMHDGYLQDAAFSHIGQRG